MKNFLVVIPTERKVRPLIEAALSLARKFHAQLDAVAIGFEETSAGLAAVGGAAVGQVLELENERAFARAEAALAIVEAEARSAQVRYRSTPIAATPYEAGEMMSALARLSELTILLQPDPDGYTPDSLIAQRVLFNSGGPALFVPYTHTGPIQLGHVGIAWDGSRTAARAVRDAAPLLPHAKRVTILSVNDASPPECDAAALQAALAVKGISAEIVKTSCAPAEIQPILLSTVADEGIDLLVMGGYGHSRLKEFVLGGVTEQMLESMTVPTLMSH